MKKFPINTIIVDIEALGGEVTLNELTQEYRVKCHQDKRYDTPSNGLLNAGLTQEQINKLGERVAIAVFEAVIDLTYPNAREDMQKMIDSGEYKEPTVLESEELKKNS